VDEMTRTNIGTAVGRASDPDTDPAYHRWSLAAGGDIGCSWSIATNDNAIEFCTARPVVAWVDLEEPRLIGYCAEHEKGMRPPLADVGDRHRTWMLITFDGIPGDVLDQVRRHETAITPAARPRGEHHQR
jgi:hypothetical protein